MTGTSTRSRLRSSKRTRRTRFQARPECGTLPNVSCVLTLFGGMLKTVGSAEWERSSYIEVQTTGLAKAFPFYVTANEVAYSDALRNEYHLYRLFRFSRNPGLYILNGRLADSCYLDPIQFRARFE